MKFTVLSRAPGSKEWVGEKEEPRTAEQAVGVAKSLSDRDHKVRIVPVLPVEPAQLKKLLEQNLTDEEALRAAYRAVEETHNALHNAASEYFMPRLKVLLDKGALADARALMLRCPDSVTQVFMMDQIREASKRTP